MSLRAVLAVGIVVLAGCGGGNGDGGEPADASGLERGRAAIRDCRVRSIVSLHSGALFLELKGGGRIELTLDDQRDLYAEIERARPRCGNVIVAME
jgi:hypothetical protein